MFCFVRSRLRRGITLIEMMVALTITIIMMGTVITVFGFIGERVTDTRSVLETSDRLRSASHRLREDLTGLTCKTMPWQRPESGNGYIEILEGPEYDYLSTDANRIQGDPDDKLMFTVRSKDRPFVGRYGNGGLTVESNLAEVVWYARPSALVTNPPTFTLCRRAFLLVSRDTTGANQDTHDVSISPATGKANTLGDLTKRENRYKHIGTPANTYPYRVDPAVFQTALASPREGDEVVLTNVVAFDVKVFDPTAPMKTATYTPAAGGPVTIGVAPGDPGYTATATAVPGALGAYVDLGDTTSANAFAGTIFGTMNSKSGMTGGYATYCTWSFHYEHDGVRQSTASILAADVAADAGTNGIDDKDPSTGNPANGIDDMNERETSPPYPVPLRGLQVTIRVYEPSSKQVREVTVTESFVPE